MSEEDRAKYRAVFIRSFGGGFRMSGAQWSVFKDWRVFKRLEDRTVIAASVGNTGQLVLLGLSMKHPRRLLELAYWMSERDPTGTGSRSDANKPL